MWATVGRIQAGRAGRGAILAFLLGGLVACGAWRGEEPPLPTPLVPPLPTALPTRGTLATLAPGTPSVPPAPSATPDPAVVSEVFVVRDTLSFRYPAGWVVEDLSDGSEILVRAQGDVGDARGFFLANLLNVEGELGAEDMRQLADTYLRNLFGEQLPTMQVSYTFAGDAVIATVIASDTTPPIQSELRFTPRPPFYQVLVLVTEQGRWDSVAPILDAMARSVAVNPEMAVFLPTPTAALERKREGLALENATLYRAPTGSLYVVGEVANNGGQLYTDVQTTIALVDGAGQEVARQTWSVERRLLPPGERSPVQAIFNAPPSTAMNIRAVADGLPGDAGGTLVATFETVDVKGSTPTFAAYALAGTLRNVGGDARGVKVVGALYDAAGKVLAVGFVTLETLEAGAEVPFTLTFYSKADGEVARHALWVEGTAVTP